MQNFEKFWEQLTRQIIKFDNSTVIYFEDGFINALVSWIFVIIVAYVGYKIIKGLLKKKNIDNVGSIITVLKAFIVILVIYSCLSQIKPAQNLLQTLLASGGILALALSLAAQESISNLVAGIIILAFKPYKVGDYIKINNDQFAGTVEEINLRHTIIRTKEFNRISIPNNIMNGTSIENADLISSKKANLLEVQVAYDTDIEKAIEVLRGVCLAHPSCIDRRTPEQKTNNYPIVTVYVVALGAYGVTLRATIFSKNSSLGFEMLSDLRQEVLKAFGKEGITIPYPTQELLVQEKKS